MDERVAFNHRIGSLPLRTWKNRRIISYASGHSQQNCGSCAIRSTMVAFCHDRTAEKSHGSMPHPAGALALPELPPSCPCRDDVERSERFSDDGLGDCPEDATGPGNH